jgi:serine/threonine protein kinase/serine/threonine protein phosphatase PrpC
MGWRGFFWQRAFVFILVALTFGDVTHTKEERAGKKEVWATSPIVSSGFSPLALWYKAKTQVSMVYRKFVGGGIVPGTVLQQEYVLKERLGKLRPSIPALPSPLEQGDGHFQNLFNTLYTLGDKFNRGSHGELWHASFRKSTGQSDQRDGSEHLVMKRLFVERSEEIRLSGLREIHFGVLLKKSRFIARYVDHFTSPRSQNDPNDLLVDLWIVFVDEGRSLHTYIYDTEHIMVRPSPFWRRLRLERDGPVVLREIMKQLLQAIHVCHQKNIAHRDIKPGNLIINSKEYPPKLRLADFGSAVDLKSLAQLYRNRGPSQRDETREYMPPEVTLSDTLPYARYGTRDGIAGAKQYDMWSIGIVWLELLLATNSPFEIDSRSQGIIKQQLKRQGITSSATVERAYFLRGLTEWGIYSPAHMKVVPLSTIPAGDGERSGTAIVTVDTTMARSSEGTCLPEKSASEASSSLVISNSLNLGSLVIAEETSIDLITMADAVSEEPLATIPRHAKNDEHDAPHDLDGDPSFQRFLSVLKAKDPMEKSMIDFLNYGEIGKWGSKLLFRLLQMNPDDRVNAEHALSHAYFQENGGYVCPSTGREYEFPEEISKFCPQSQSQTSDSSILNQHPMPDLFECPACGRKFGSWSSCHTHMHARKHNTSREVTTSTPITSLSSFLGQRKKNFCLYDRTRVPACDLQKGFGLRHHRMWHNGESGTFDTCGMRGRRKYMEDYFSTDSATFTSPGGGSQVVDMYGMFDGHLGTFTANALTRNLFRSLKVDIAAKCDHTRAQQFQETKQIDCVREAFLATFLRTDRDILDAMSTSKKGGHFSIAKSGSTATVLVRISSGHEDETVLVVGSVGDSRAVMCCLSDGSPMSMSKDHKPDVPVEKHRIEANGGFIEKRGVWRVQGHLAISRSFGDLELKKQNLLVSTPSFANYSCGAVQHCLFVILASDGVWDVIDNDEAVGIVNNSLVEYGPHGNKMDRHQFCQEASRRLSEEAYVRDSRDNIGVMIVALF